MSSICEYPQNNSELLDRGKTNRHNTIFLANEVCVVLPHDQHNLHKQIPVHPKTTLKYHFPVQLIISEEVIVHHAVGLQPLPRLALVLPLPRASPMYIQIPSLRG
jgi:hypothetical protein